MIVGNLSTPTPEIVTSVPESIARENRIVPLATLNAKLIVGSDRVLTSDVRETLRFVLDCEVRVVRRSTRWGDSFLNASYSAVEVTEATVEDSRELKWY